MILVLDLVAYALLFFFLWITSFLVHELCHIIGAGTLHGTITIDGLSMSATPANLWAGGLGSGLIYAVAGALVWLLGNHPFAWLFLTIAAVQGLYGTFEGICLPTQNGVDTEEYWLGRWTIYLCVSTAMLIYGLVFIR